MLNIVVFNSKNNKNFLYCSLVLILAFIMTSNQKQTITMKNNLPLILRGSKEKSLFLFLMIFFTLFTSTMVAQTCIGPYQYFEGVKTRATMITDTWALSPAGATTVTSTPGNARSGSSYVVLGTTNHMITTPKIASPSTFKFYIRGASTATANFKVEWSTDPAFVTPAPTLIVSTNSGGTTTYQPISYSGFGGATDVYVRVTNLGGGGLFLDDFSWTSTNTNQNNIIVPELGTSICNTVTLASAVSIPYYSLFDHGGQSDTYSKSQNHTLSIQSCSSVSKKVKLTFNSAAALASGDTFSVYNGTADASGNPTGVLLASGATFASGTTLISCATDGSLTVKFNSTSTSTLAAGLDIKVECVDAAAAATLIASQPSTTSQSVCVGSPASPLSVTVLGTVLSPVYQWYSNTSSSNVGGTLIAGATSASYTPPSAVANIGTNYYYCVVTNGCDSETSAVSGGVTVNAVPADVVVSSSGTYCTSTTLTAANGSSGTIYWQNTTSNGTSTATMSSSQLVSTSGTYYFRAQLSGCWGVEGSATVVINNAPAAPVALAGSSATTSSITANWNAVAGATGYYLDVSTSSTFATFVSGYNDLSVGNVTTYNVTGLSIGVTYYYRVRANNSCGSGVSSATITYNTLSASYCASTSSSSTAYFSSFTTTGGVTNISNLSSGYSTSGYGDFTASQIVTQVQGGAVTFATTVFGISGGVGVSIFVDWNQNGVFTDAGETVFSTNGIYAYTSPTGSFTVPASALTGATRMRIVSNYYSSTPVSCNSGITGETEDYTFVVTTLPCSGNPSAATITIVSMTSSTATWTAPSPAPANGYQYYLSTSSTTPSTSATPTGSTAAGVTTVTLTGLTASTNYYFWVRSNCGGALGQGAWMGVTGFFQPNCNVGNGSGTTTLGCPEVIAGGIGLNGADPAPIASCTSGSCVTLEANYLQLGQTTSYSVQTIPYNPPYQYNCLQNPINVSVDDKWSQSIDLPFNFCFYGNNYNKCLMGSNGVLTFDIVNNTPGGYSAWSFANNLPSTSLFLNSIFGVYHDIDPSKGGQIGWELITLNTGCRALVASWTDIPMFSSSCNSMLYTGMIVLYENTNVIEVYIKEKNVCASWNDGNAIVGLQNSDGTQAVVAPNRNGLDTNWTVTNEAWRFVPSGPSITTIKWYQGAGVTGPVVGTTNTVSVCPPANTTYTAEVTYTLCNGTTLKKTDTTDVVVMGSKMWNGSIDSDWNKPNNWTPAIIPTATECVVIPVTAHDPIVSQVVVGVPYHALAGTLTILNGAKLTINSNNTIAVTEWVKVEPTANFIIEDDASLVQVTNVVTNVNSGNITYKRNATIRSVDYVYWSSPVAGFNVNNIAAPLLPGAVFKWNTTIANGNGGYGNWENASGSTMVAAKGYIARGPSSFSATASSTLNGLFTGVPNNGVISFPISRGIDQNTAYHAGTNGIEITNLSDNWNLVGNPYPSSIRGSQFLYDNQSKIEGQIRLWTHGTVPATIPSPFYGTYLYNYTPGDYYTYNFTGTSCCPAANVDLFIGASQGFFVVMKDGAAGSDTVTFNNTLRSDAYDNSIFYRTSSSNSAIPNGNPVNRIERNRIWLDLTNPSGQTERTLVGYVEGATLGKDSFFDAGTLVSGAMTVYSLIDTGKYIIQGRPTPFNPNDIVPIGAFVPASGRYSFAIGGVDGLFENPNKNIYLEDTKLGVIHDLRLSPYEVYLNSGTYNDRFKLRYKYPKGYNNAKTTTHDFEESVVVSSNNGKIAVRSSYEAIDEITIYDVLGRPLFEAKKVNENEFLISDLMVPEQTLVIKIKLENGTLTTKKIVL